MIDINNKPLARQLEQVGYEFKMDEVVLTATNFK